MDILKVSARSNPSHVAGALCAEIREKGRADMQTVGAGALNQGIKSVAIARNFFDLLLSPSFETVTIDGKEVTAIKLSIEERKN